MDEAKRARTAETPKQPCLGLKLRAPYFYPDQEPWRRRSDDDAAYPSTRERDLDSSSIDGARRRRPSATPQRLQRPSFVPCDWRSKPCEAPRVEDRTTQAQVMLPVQYHYSSALACYSIVPPGCRCPTRRHRTRRAPKSVRGLRKPGSEAVTS
jgi:hypothetical protein